MYLGKHLPPELFLNAPFHFPIHGGWPLISDWCSSFQIKHFVSLQAQFWTSATVNIQDASFEVMPLGTVADEEAAAHQQRNPVLAASLHRTTVPSSHPPASAALVRVPSHPMVPPPAAPPRLLLLYQHRQQPHFSTAPTSDCQHRARSSTSHASTSDAN
jgi:hypothetical protein